MASMEVGEGGGDAWMLKLHKPNWLGPTEVHCGGGGWGWGVQGGQWLTCTTLLDHTFKHAYNINIPDKHWTAVWAHGDSQ